MVIVLYNNVDPFFRAAMYNWRSIMLSCYVLEKLHVNYIGKLKPP